MNRPVLSLFAISSLVVLAACGGGAASTDETALAAAPEEASANATTFPDEDLASGKDWYAAAGISVDDNFGPHDASALRSRAIERPAPKPAPSPPAGGSTAAVVSDSARLAAATATATGSTNLCAPVRPFYWEIGTKAAKAASGSVDSTTLPGTYTSTTRMSLASASKWLYGSYVAQRQNGFLSDSDRKYLSMLSGYVSLSSCDRGSTVGSCESAGTNGVYTASADGKFDYDGGHFEKHATLIGLSALNATTLATEVRSRLGTDVDLSYSTPQLAGGALTTPDGYARVLRKMLGGQLVIGSMLGSNAVCTNPVTCGRDKALLAPLPPTESWHYSVAHWVEDDPIVGDGAFSSPGLFGFYPWIDRTKTYYGVLARASSDSGAAFASVQCGRLIRKAWLTGVAM